MKKSERFDAIRERCRIALAELYHNATPKHPDVPESVASHYWAWFEGAAAMEVDYISGGGAYGGDKYMRKYFENRYKNPGTAAYAWRRYRRQRDCERSRCNGLDSRDAAVTALWECASEYGEIYRYGRGGRTLAPSGLVECRGGSGFRIRAELAGTRSIAETVRMCLVIESFNRYVWDWCRSVPELWCIYCLDNPEVLAGGDDET